MALSLNCRPGGGSKLNRKHFVLGIDGMPFSLLNKKIKNNKMPKCKKIIEKGNFKAIDSVMPPVSSVAWTSYATGKYPKEHGIFGFTEKDSSHSGLYIPTTVDRKAETIWSRLSGKGKKVVVLNVPFTYPPEAVNGIMVSCFLCPKIENATYPKVFHHKLAERGYIIDVEAPSSEEDIPRFIEDLFTAMKIRVELSIELMEHTQWDYFHLHIMETDRLFHFLWDSVAGEKEDLYSKEVDRFFEALDNHIDSLFCRLPHDTGFTILSDHGFNGIQHEVQLNTWLKKEGYFHPDKLYSLTPGRIYIHSEANEKEILKKQLKEKILKLEDSSHHKVIQNVFFEEEIYQGMQERIGPNMVVHPFNGYDLKSNLREPNIFTNSLLTGMHTFENAMLISTLDITDISDITGVAEKIIEEICDDHI